MLNFISYFFSDTKTLRKIIVAEVNTREAVESAFRKENEKSRKKSTRNNEIAKESLIEEKLEKELIKLFFEYQKEKKKKEEKTVQNEAVIILAGPIETFSKDTNFVEEEILSNPEKKEIENVILLNSHEKAYFRDSVADNVKVSEDSNSKSIEPETEKKIYCDIFDNNDIHPNIHSEQLDDSSFRFYR